MYHESHGPSLKDLREQKREANLHHLRVYAHPEATAEAPKWIIEHHTSENDEHPGVYEVSDANEGLQHISEHAHMYERGK